MAFTTGEMINVKVVFRDMDSGSNTFGSPIDPATVDVTLYLDGAVVFTEAATNEDVGVYSHDFFVSSPGVYDLEFVGTFADNSTSRVSSVIPVDTELDLVYLGQNYEFTFFTDLDPLYLDPEDFEGIYPEASTTEVTELIHRFSKEVQTIYKDQEIPHIAIEYIRAAVECSLYRTYDIGFSGTGNAFTLGDLSVSKTPQSNKYSTNRGSASTPCELAAALRTEMMRSRTGMKAVTTGSNYRNPMPKRKLRHAERHF